MYVGVGARRVRDLFAAAKRRAPCIVFIDEIDAIGSTRALKEQQAMKMTLNQLLVELDGFKESEGVIIMGATNFPEILDNALVRPGRFDRQVTVPLPDIKGRRDILELYLSKVPAADDVNVDDLARATTGSSGADLSNIVNEAAIRAAVRGADTVTMADLEYARDRVAMGAERKSAVIPEKVREVTAYHEGGHTLVSLFTENAMPLSKVTIIPRGEALGVTMSLPEEADMVQRTRKQLLAQLDVAMGGRAAEELIYGSEAVTSGASSDFKFATDMSRAMVTRWGMSPSAVSEGGVGHMFVPDRDKEVSPDMRKAVDEEVKRLLEASYERALNLLKAHKKDLEKLAKALLERETLTTEEVHELLGIKVRKKSN